MKIVNGNEPHYYSDRLKLKLNKLCSTSTAIKHLVWDALSELKQTFLLRLSSFEAVTVQ